MGIMEVVMQWCHDEGNTIMVLGLIDTTALR